MTPTDMLIGELVGMRCTIAALAREILLRAGSDAFIHAEAQAVKFVETSQNVGVDHQEIRERALAAVRDTFRMADHA